MTTMGVLDNVDYLKNIRRENRGSKIIKMKVYIPIAPNSGIYYIVAYFFKVSMYGVHFHDLWMSI